MVFQVLNNIGPPMVDCLEFVIHAIHLCILCVLGSKKSFNM